jgi:hypothetical protein
VLGVEAEQTQAGGDERLSICYAYVMSIKRITISVPDSVAARIKKAAGSAAVSAWVTGVIEEHLDDAELEREWERFYRDVAPSAAAERRAESLFKRLTKRRRTAA